MHKLTATLAALLAASVAVLAEQAAPLIVVSIPNGRLAYTNTLANLSGYVENIQVLASDGYSTGTVSLIALPLDSTGASETLVAATACSNAPRMFRPRVDGTTTLGADNTSDPPERFYLFKQTIRMSVYDSNSNLTWWARVKLSDH